MAESAVQALTPIPLDLTEKEPLQILHVDDDVGFLKVAKYCLETQGPHQVDTAQSVEQAKEKMQQKTYDALVCDYKMPEEDGLQFLKELRDHGNNIPFLIFTGKGREEAAIKALNLGADRYLNKQGDPETVYGELAHAIHQAVKAKLARQAMMESERRYRSIFEEALDAIFVADAETGILLDCNQAASKLVDRDKSELVGKRQRILHPPEQIEGEFSRTFKEHLKEKEGQVLETQVITKNGEIKDVEIKANTLELKGEKLIQGIFRDITERKRIEQKLRNREERLRQALETAVDGVWFIDTEGVTTYVNDAMAEMLGYTKEEMLGKSVLHFASQEEIERFNKLFQRRKKGVREVLQFTFRKKSG
nr:PAS domain S-box protein [Candidatus Bathyarchaeota archaeon]NIR16095.1 PAS domain S-box protein [Desulfobacterales bacterium]NIU81267.1 PAS domain S-box protein [Candidatus Bathyarchaeota archaeon]NIV67911.1 PAS domain S-box protein [Candidatus Bathyarchaeota archaeon]NIW34494.1 PAS domain S-box protein [Candidatus Bathyarchaeota archaeon]